MLRQLTTILDGAGVGMACLQNGLIVEANLEMARLSGHTLEDLLGAPYRLLFESDLDYARAEAQLEAALRKRPEGMWRGERRLMRRDGRLVWAQVSERALHPSMPEGGIIATYVDVDDRWRAEASLRQQSERERTVLDSVLVGVVTIGRDGIEWMNRSARRMFGAGLDELAGMALSTVATADPEHPFRQVHYLDELPEGRAETFECQVVARDGRQFLVAGNVVATGTADQGRQLTYALLDIEHRRQAEAERLAAAIAQRELLVREVHHRIKNNLQGVAGLLQQAAARRPEVADVISEAVGQVRSIAQVYGLQVGQPGPLRLAEVIAAITGSVQRNHGRDITCELGSNGEITSSPWVLPETESIPIALALNELLTNAVKHGTGTAQCRLLDDDGEVCVEVTNPGHLPVGFALERMGGISGLGLVRSLLPRRSALLSLEQQDERVVCRVALWPPSVIHRPIS